MKKFWSLCVAIVMVVTLTACGNSQSEAEKEVVNFLDLLQDGKTKDALENFADLQNIAMTEEMNGGMDVISEFLKQIDYKVIETKENGDSATVKVEVTVIDGAVVGEKVVSEFILEATKEAAANPNIDQMTLVNKLFDKLKSAASDSNAPKKTITIDFNVVEIDGKWQLNATPSDFSNLIGGLDKQLSSM